MQASTAYRNELNVSQIVYCRYCRERPAENFLNYCRTCWENCDINQTSNKAIYLLQRELLENSDLRVEFNQEWRELEAILLANGLNKNEAMLNAIRQTRDSWKEKTK